MKSTVASKGMGTGGTSTATTFIKGAKMRTDTVTEGMTRSQIIDMDAMKIYSFDSKSKEVNVYDMAQLAAGIAKNVQVGDIKAALKAERQDQAGLRPIRERFRHGSQRAGADGRGPGHEDHGQPARPGVGRQGRPRGGQYLAFYKSAAEKGWFFSDPRIAQAQPDRPRRWAKCIASSPRPAASHTRWK